MWMVEFILIGPGSLREPPISGPGGLRAPPVVADGSIAGNCFHWRLVQAASVEAKVAIAFTDILEAKTPLQVTTDR